MKREQITFVIALYSPKGKNDKILIVKKIAKTTVGMKSRENVMIGFALIFLIIVSFRLSFVKNLLKKANNKGVKRPNLLQGNII